MISRKVKETEETKGNRVRYVYLDFILDAVLGLHRRDRIHRLRHLLYRFNGVTTIAMPGAILGLVATATILGAAFAVAAAPPTPPPQVPATSAPAPRRV